MVVFSLKLAVEPAGQIAERLGHGLFGVFGRRLPGRAVPRDVNGNRVFVVVAPAMADLGGKLVGVVCGRGRNPTLRLWPTIFSGKIDVFPGDRRSRLISSMTSVAPA